MAGLEHLTFTSELKTSLLKSLAQKNQIQLLLKYDREFDALMLLWVSPDIESIVHYIDDQVALLYQSETKEIVGMQIEDFEHSFLPRHDTVQRVWRLSEADAKIEDLGDLIFAIERKKPGVAREIFKATEDLLGNEGVELSDAIP